MKTNIYAINKIVKGVPVTDGAGVKLRRIIGTPQLSHIDPFVLFDEFKSGNPDDYIAGFPTHPHRGIETITYMKSGSFRHKDSKGGGGILNSGDVQWMTAGRGILHSEMPENQEGQVWGYQLWLSLKTKDKMVPPRYQHISVKDIPETGQNGLRVKVISGEFGKIKGPAENYVKSLYLDVSLEKNGFFVYRTGPDMNGFCYVHTGRVTVNPGSMSIDVREGELALFDQDSVLEIKGHAEKAGFLFVAGVPNNEPIVQGGPFVMNTEEEIRQAFQDYQNGLL